MCIVGTLSKKVENCTMKIEKLNTLYALSIFLFISFNSVASSFVVITTLYNEKNEERRQEFIKCLERNLAHELITEICVMYDTSKDDQDNQLLEYLKTKPVRLMFISARPTFGDCFELAEQLYSNSTIIIANADIYFNHTLHQLVPYDLKNVFIALTRWDVLPSGRLTLFKDPFGIPWGRSQDVWIFQTPFKKLLKTDFALGTYGCDNAIAYWAHKSGLRVINPALSIQACHLHSSNIRNYSYNSPYPEHERRGVLLNHVHVLKKLRN